MRPSLWRSRAHRSIDSDGGAFFWVFCREEGCCAENAVAWRGGFFQHEQMRISVFGLGIIGSIWARLWRAEGHEVRSWNRTPKPQEPTFCADAREAARGTELVAICVSDGAAVMSVLESISEVLRPGVVVGQHSTLSVADTLRARDFVAAHGGIFLDMPFTGSKLAAEARQVVFYAAGDARAVDVWTPVYRCLGRKIFFLGEPPRATVLKLAMNLMIAGVYQSLAEGFELALRHGLDAELFWAALDMNVAKSGVADLKRPKMMSGDYSPHFSVKHMHKDLRQALEAARDKQLILKQTQELERTYSKAEDIGLGDLDFSALLQILRSG